MSDDSNTKAEIEKKEESTDGGEDTTAGDDNKQTTAEEEEIGTTFIYHFWQFCLLSFLSSLSLFFLVLDQIV